MRPLLSGILGVPEKADYWRQQADVFLNAMLHHPTCSLTDKGALIKRRNVNGEIADLTSGRQQSWMEDAPAGTEYYHRLNPDATVCPSGLVRDYRSPFGTGKKISG